MKKKILFVIDSLNSGGAEKSLTSLLSCIDYGKYDVDLLMFKSEGLYLELVPETVNILPVPDYFNDEKKKYRQKLKFFEYKTKNSILIRWSKYKNTFHVAQIIAPNILHCLPSQKEKYDVAIAYSQGLPTYYVADKVCSGSKICWINTDYKKAGYNKEFDYVYYNKFKYIVSVSEKSKIIFEKVYPEFKNKLRVIYDTISPELIYRLSNTGNGYKDEFRGIRILTIGRHVKLKGYDMAIEAAKKMEEMGVDFKWYSIGEGELSIKLKELVKKNNLERRFIFLGTQINPYQFIKECDIYCQPSRFEGYGMAIAEAKILNKLIVATNFDIVHDQIKNGVNGFIVEMNCESIYEQILKLIQNSDLTKNIVENLKNENKGNIDGIEKLYELINI